MADTFDFQLLSPAHQIAKGQVSEVVLPGYDGEVGVLVKHEGFLGTLGTGVLKVVRDGNDYWFMVSSGIYQVRDGALIVLAEIVESASDIDIDATKERLKSAASEIEKRSAYAPGYEKLSKEVQQLRARVEVHRRTELVQ
jgi:F-type H+-transporting ATPase subunit epsilon